MKKLNKDIYKVEYVITDRGTKYPIQTIEVIVKAGKTVEESLKTYLNKARYSMQLSTKFTFEIISRNHCGWC